MFLLKGLDSSLGPRCSEEMKAQHLPTFYVYSLYFGWGHRAVIAPTLSPKPPSIPGTSKPPRTDHPADETNYPLERSYIQECLLGTTSPPQAIKTSLLLIILTMCTEGDGAHEHMCLQKASGGIGSGAGVSTKLGSWTRAANTLPQNQ